MIDMSSRSSESTMDIQLNLQFSFNTVYSVIQQLGFLTKSNLLVSDLLLWAMMFGLATTEEMSTAEKISILTQVKILLISLITVSSLLVNMMLQLKLTLSDNSLDTTKLLTLVTLKEHPKCTQLLLKTQIFFKTN